MVGAIAAILAVIVYLIAEYYPKYAEKKGLPIFKHFKLVAFIIWFILFSIFVYWNFIR